MKGRAIHYSNAEMAWLEANRMMVISDYHRAFVAEFDRQDVTAAQLHYLRKRKGWKIGPTTGRFKGRRLRYSEAEVAWIRENIALSIGDLHRAYCAHFQRDDVSAANLNALRKREGIKTGRAGHFEKGHVSHNKGKRCEEGRMGRHPNARKTQFKKGQVPHNHAGAGHEYIDTSGYVVIIIDEPNPWNGQKTRPIHKHRYLWEKANGPVPDGMMLKCLDGNRQNTDPSNWEMLPRGVQPFLNGHRGFDYEAADPELKPAILTLAKLRHKAKTLRDGAAA